MRFKNFIFILALFMVLLCCFSAVNASENVDNSITASDDVAVDEVVSEVDSDDESISVQENEEIESSDDVDNESLEVSDVEEVDDVDDSSSVLSAEENDNEVSGQTPNGDTIEIWVNKNVSSSGDGSKENPFSNLQDAHDKIIDSSSKNAIINIEDGEYEIPYKNTPPMISGPDFYFRDVNLVVNGLGNNVILSAGVSSAKTFQISTGYNFTINNINFKISISNWDVVYGAPDVNTYRSVPLTNCSINVINCTFAFNSNYNGLVRNEYDINYIGCVFINSGNRLFTSSKESPGSCYFENCIFINPHFSNETYFANDAIFNGIWLSSNTIPTYSVYMVVPTYHWETMDVFTTTAGTGDSGLNYVTCLEKYAIFSVSENYLGDNQYEIVGKLTWNGTDSSEGMENFPPMPVSLKSTTGVIQNATLINGIFKVNYTSSASEHKVTVKLDSEEKNLTFANIDLGLSAPTITYGDNQNITVTFPQKVNGTVTVTVNGKEYLGIVKDSYEITVSINDVLNVGSHKVNVAFVDEKNHIYGSNATTITISSINTKITALNVSTTYNVTKDLVVTLTDAKGGVLANKTVNIVVGTINKNLNTDEDGQISIDISTLAPDTYIANIIFGGDEIYAESSTTATVIVKADIKTNITIPEITAGKATTTTIKLPENATGNITVTIDGKVASVVNLTNGSAIITIPELSAGKHDVVISYSGDGNYAAFSQNSTVTVKEPAKPIPTPAPVKKAKQATKIVAKNKKFKAKTKVKKYTITLKTKAGKAVKKVQVTIKIGKKTYKAKTNAKGKATFKIKKLTKKAKYTATIKFKGNKNYKASTKKVKITIKK